VSDSLFGSAGFALVDSATTQELLGDPPKFIGNGQHEPFGHAGR